MVDETKAGRGRILVVDDDPGALERVLGALRSRGYQVEGAADGLQALARLQHGGFDVVVTDFQMPRLNGLALLREVHRLVGPLPVLIHTTLVDPSLESLLLAAGAFRVLMKGGPLGDLLQSVEAAWQNSRSARTTASEARP